MKVAPETAPLALLAKVLGVDEIEYDHEATIRRPHSQARISPYGGVDLFYDPVMRWRIDGKRFAAAVPVILVRSWRGLRGEPDRWVKDDNAMQRIFIDMVEETKRNPESAISLESLDSRR